MDIAEATCAVKTKHWKGYLDVADPEKDLLSVSGDHRLRQRGSVFHSLNKLLSDFFNHRDLGWA